MCKFRLFSSLAITLCFSTSISYAQFPKLLNVENFDDFLKQTGKVYPDPTERQFRESIFLSKKAVVDVGNRQVVDGSSSFRMAINPLADLTSAEVGRMTGSKVSFTGEQITSKHSNFVTAKLKTNLPESFDWRAKGGVTRARFQGLACGSCWSFATIGALEGHLFRRTTLLVPLSEQNLVDCGEKYGSMGCDGGFQEYAFEYIRHHGIALAFKYPYTEIEADQCHRNRTGNGIKIRDYARIKPGDEERMKEVIATQGPLACSMNGSPISFEQYRGGVYDDDGCNQEDVNHSVVVVGYGSENGKEFWIVKNSYSENWGENGFMKLVRNKGNFCGIASECSYPIL